jgi:hypothetical protein
MNATAAVSNIASESPSQELCSQCHHSWDAHRLCGYGEPPTEGWMECPVEGCECRKTWSLSPEIAVEVKAQAATAANANSSAGRTRQVPLWRSRPAYLAFLAAIAVIAVGAAFTWLR